MKVLIACEFSGRVRDAFLHLGYDAVSCDLLPSESSKGFHYQGDIFDILDDNWDLLIAHPPCTHLASSGARRFSAKKADGRQQEAIDFFLRLTETDIQKVCIENPVGIMSTVFRKPDQIVQPWQFGHPETKATCLWLKNLHPLVPTRIVSGREQKIHSLPPGPNRWKDRSRTYRGIATAMAEQWGDECWLK